MIDPLSPVAYLDKEPSEAELAQSQPAKVWQLVRVAMVAHSTKVWISGRRAFERRMRNMALASVAALIGGLCTCAATAQTHLKEAGAEQERNAEFGRRLDSLEHKIDVIQQALMHSSDATPSDTPRSDFLTDPGYLKIPNKLTSNEKNTPIYGNDFFYMQSN